MGSSLKFLTRYAQEGDEFLDSIVTGDETWGFHHTAESSDDDDEVQEEVMTWFKGLAADFYDSGIQKQFPMPATMLKNKVMYRQFIHGVAFVN
jgi:hypothetical protein